MSERVGIGALPDDLALLPADPTLGLLLADVDRSSLSDQAQLLADLHAVGQRSDTALALDDDHRRYGRWAQVEVAFAMRWTHRAAATQLALADDLLDRLPAVFAALDRGDIDIPKARVFTDLTCGLEAPTARRVVDQVLDQASGWTTGQLRARLHRLVPAVDPQAAATRAKRALTGRRVQARLTDDNLGELCGFDLPPHRVAAAMERLTAIARAAKNDGDRRKMDQLRADALLDLLIGDGIAAGGPITDAHIGDENATDGPLDDASTASRVPDRPQRPPSPEPADRDGDDAVDPDQTELRALWAAGFDQLPVTRPCPADGESRGAMPAPRKGVIDLQVPLVTLMGLVDFPGDLGGWGPVIADIARQVAAQQPDATWRFSVYDELGELAAHGTTRRRPTAADTAFIKARDRTCRAPGCRMPARLCEVDHTDAWASSKDSRRRNIASLCKRHHLFKHLAGSDLTQITPGVLGWTTPLGQRFVTTPATYPDDPLTLASVR